MPYIFLHVRDIYRSSGSREHRACTMMTMGCCVLLQFGRFFKVQQRESSLLNELRAGTVTFLTVYFKPLHLLVKQNSGASGA